MPVLSTKRFTIRVNHDGLELFLQINLKIVIVPHCIGLTT